MMNIEYMFPVMLDVDSELNYKNYKIQLNKKIQQILYYVTTNLLKY